MRLIWDQPGALKQGDGMGHEIEMSSHCLVSYHSWWSPGCSSDEAEDVPHFA